MAGICFFYEDATRDVWSGRRSETLNAWHYAAKAAGGIDKMLVVNRTREELVSPSKEYEFTVVDEIPILSHAAYVEVPWGVNADRAEPLWDFDHKVDWYVFGPSDGWRGDLPAGDGNEARVITVPMNGQGALHSVHIAQAVLLHRYSTLKVD